MFKKKVVSISVALLMVLNLFVIIPVVALNNKNTDLSVTLDVMDNKRYYKSGDKVKVGLNLDNYNEKTEGIVGFQYDFSFSDELFSSIVVDKSSAKINSGDTYQVVDKGNKTITGIYYSNMEKPTQLNDINSESDDKGSYYILPKNNKTIAIFTLSIKDNISAEMLDKKLIEDNHSLIFESRDENSKIKTKFSFGKINVINTTPILTVNGNEYNSSSNLGIIDKDVTIKTNRKDDIVKVYKDNKLIEGTEFTQNGNYKVTVQDVTGNEITVSFTIKKVELKSISIQNKPTKLNYYIGDKLDLTGATIVENYSDGTKSEPIQVTENMVDVKKLDKEGQQEIVITYKDLKTSFYVTVDKKVEVSLDKIEVSTKLDCIYTSQELSNEDFKVVAHYSDGTKSEVFGFEIDSAYKNVEVGKTATITITYEEKTNSIILPVKERLITGIEVIKNPNKVEYVEKENQELDLTGGKIEVNYNVGESLSLDMANEDVKVSGFVSTKVGEQTITVTYKENIAEFKVNVVEKELVSITATNPNKTDYYIGQDLDLAGTVVTAKYNNDATKEIALNECTISNIDITTAGEKEVVITYKSKGFTIKVNYKDLEISKIELVGTPKKEYIEGDNLDISKLSLKLYYKEVDTTNNIPVTLDMCVVPDMNTVGTKSVVVKYKNFSVNYDINVKAKSLVGVDFDGTLKNTQYLQGQKLDLAGISVIAKYDNNTKEDVTSNVVIDFDNMTISEKAIVKVSYKGYEKEYKVSVLSRENVDLFNQQINKIISKPITVTREYFEEVMSIKQKLDKDITSMSALELKEVKDSYENFKNYFNKLQEQVLPAFNDVKLNDNLFVSINSGNIYFDEEIKVYDIKTNQNQEKLIKQQYGDMSKAVYHFKADIQSKQKQLKDTLVTYKYTVDDNNIKVSMLNGNELKEVESNYENGQVVFNGSLDGEYILVNTKSQNNSNTNISNDNTSNNSKDVISQNNSNSNQQNNDVKLTKTGDYTNIKLIKIVIFVVMGLALVGLVVLIVIKKKK